MSKTRLAIGIALVGAGGAVVFLAMRAMADRQAQADKAARETAVQAEVERLAAQQRAIEVQVGEAASLKPLNAAIDDHVDGPTLIDLFENEEWWQPFRDGFASTRVIIDDKLLGSRGALDLGTRDSETVQAARKQRVASARVDVDGKTYLVGAARLPALPDHEPVLVLVRLAPPAPPAPAITVAPARLADRPIPLAVAGALALCGLALAASGLRRRPAAAAGHVDGMVGGVIHKESTLRFGTPARPMPMPPGMTGAAPSRPPLASGSAISIPGTTGPASAAVAPVVSVSAHSAQPVVMGQTTFGRYKLIDRLGEGGMSEIFTAETEGVEGFSRTFVLKRLRPELCRDKEAVAQFIDEARMQASLVHSNIVPVFDFGVVGGEYFMTQEYIAGRDLGRLMARYQQQTGRHGLEPRLAYYFAYETLQALAYAHDRHDKNGAPLGIVHRDVSAGNIIVSLQGEVKLFDFGIVKSNRRVSKTQVGMVKGNANFMSPEQARGMNVDARSDLFSLAQVLFFCLTNQLLYSGDNDLDVLYKAATGPTMDDYRRIHELPEPAGQILEKALTFDPRERFQSAAEFADQLAAHAGGGKADAANLMQLLFGEELHHEAA